ncbi:nitrilase-related carbon-nitrogen hydrolase [Nocardia camponoti]|uniref:Nitrilase n=1 Tax=Nocardia camponoti TaxID=1616106 RepID=A0A917QMY1_9NOCA|nr:nitrilase-related carbon-nitrogen hydrolase [Nocardia camponoti]GGK57299.1 nitrilase [Nocardia camponoti]
MTIQFRAAAVQAEPAWLDLAAGVAQTLSYIEDAAAVGANLIAFPDAFVPGYPWWLWHSAVDWDGDFRARYLANAMSADGPELRAIADAARWAHTWVVLGFAERAGQALYLAHAVISPAGIVRVSRKPSPTHLEREVFDDGVGLPPVVDTELGRIGVLGGADHLCPDRRADLWREQVHVAAFSGFTEYHEVSDDIVVAVNASVSAQYARDAGVAVIASAAVAPLGGWSVRDRRSPGFVRLRGGGDVARILSSEGNDLVPPLKSGESGLLVADVVVAESADPWMDWAAG